MYEDWAKDKLLVHSPTRAEPNIFYPPLAKYQNVTRDIGIVIFASILLLPHIKYILIFIPFKHLDVLIIGAVEPFVYPLRYRVKEMIRKGIIPNGYIREHPGYFIMDKDATEEDREEQYHQYSML